MEEKGERRGGWMEDMTEITNEDGRLGDWEGFSFLFFHSTDVLECQRSPLNSKKEHSEFRFLLFVVSLSVVRTFWERKKNRSCQKKFIISIPFVFQ